MFGRLLRWYTIYTFPGALAPNGILPGAKFTLCPRLAFSYIASVNALHSSNGHQPNFAAFSRRRHLYSAGGHQVIGPHSSLYSIFQNKKYILWNVYLPNAVFKSIGGFLCDLHCVQHCVSHYNRDTMMLQFCDLDLGQFKIIQGQRSWCQSIAHAWFP